MSPNKRQKTKHETVIIDTRQPTKLNLGFLITPDAPLIFASYAGVILHITCLLGLLALLFGIYKTVSKEVCNRFEQDVQFLESIVGACRQRYSENYCSSPDLAPFLIPYCDQWEQCMQRDSTMIGRAKIGTRIFGELINSIIESLSLKSMVSQSWL
ncbi:Di-sulfide bridge nucleocytoplasmic transport domain-containing protein [Phycomyces nitens]|nr:Di-sulfide bridge nucleocytoplasmic transport domain-containing protein [Phycomyces nitens]